MKASEAKCSTHGYDLSTNLWFEEKCPECEGIWLGMDTPEFDPAHWKKLAQEVRDKNND